MDHLGGLIEIVAHNELQLSNKDTHEEEHCSDLKCSNLDVELDKSNPGSPVEGLPCIKHADTADATNNLGLNFAAEAPVKGNDRFVFLRQHGCLNTGQGDLGGEDNSEDDEQSDKDTSEHRDDVISEGLGGDLVVVGWIFGVAIETVDAEDHSRNVNGKLFSGSPDGGGEKDLVASLPAGETAPPTLRTWVAHDNMGPCHAETPEDGMGDHSEERLGKRGLSEGAE